MLKKIIKTQLKNIISPITIKTNIYIFIISILLISLPLIIFGNPNWLDSKSCYIIC